MFILNKIRILFFILLMLVCSSVFADEESLFQPEEMAVDLSHSITLHGGWYTFAPFQYQVVKNGVSTLTGLDYELMNAFARKAKIRLAYQQIEWDDLLLDLHAGKADFATGVLYTKDRADYVYYSIPYRYAEASLFLQEGKISGLSRMPTDTLLNYLKQNQLKVAVVRGFIYSDPMIDAYIKNPANASLVIKTDSDNESLDLLLNGDVDAFVADRVVGTNLIWQANASVNIVEHRLRVKSPIYLIFSKKSVSPAVVEKFNQSIRQLHNSETYRNIVSWYLYPAIVFQIKNSLWFKITELVGIIAFAISGLLIAFREKTTLFGAIILAILPSLGGGLMRDIIFGRHPVGALQSPLYLSTVLLTVLTGFVVIKILSHYRRRNKIPREIEDAILGHAAALLAITDAIGLATFTVIGVMVSLLAKANPLWLWGPFFAFVTGAGGGILRDMLSKSRRIEALEGEFYGELAVIWGFFLSEYILLSANQAQPEYMEYAVVLTIVGVFVSRLVVHFMRLPNVNFKHLT